MKILVVEDNLVNQQLSVSLLEKEGYEVMVAANGKEAVDLYNENHFDVILMDLDMPVMNGIEATSAIRRKEESNNKSNKTPIVIVTGIMDQNELDRYINDGVDDCIIKPYRAQELYDKINKHTTGIL